MGLKTTYAVILYLITMTVGLAESSDLARTQALDMRVVRNVLDWVSHAFAIFQAEENQDSQAGRDQGL